MKITKTRLLEIIKEELQIVVEKKKKQQKGEKRARKSAKRKKKKKAKRDACYHKVRSRYDVWPSAYASGALVKCRKVGAANWGKSTTKEEVELEEGKMSQSYCEDTPCDEMGFSQKASCKSQGFKNCYD